MEEKIVLTAGETTFTNETLMAIGEEIASLWGGCCVEFEIEESLVRFFCKEHEELFYCDIAFEDLIVRLNKLKGC